VIAIGRTFDLFYIGRKVLKARLFPVAMELVSSEFAKLLDIHIAKMSTLLLIRFAGNEKAVEYQIQQTFTHLKHPTIESTEVLYEDSQLWRSVAAVPVKDQPSLTRYVPPMKLTDPASAPNYGSPWQRGVADGRIRQKRTPFDPTPTADPLSQRVKEQLDPYNLFGGKRS